MYKKCHYNNMDRSVFKQYTQYSLSYRFTNKISRIGNFMIILT